MAGSRRQCARAVVEIASALFSGRSSLRRGLIAENQGNDAIAKSDLEASARLLPMGVAAYGLGNIASRANDLNSARRYYTAAAQAGGEVGKAARQALAQLDAQQSPAN